MDEKMLYSLVVNSPIQGYLPIIHLVGYEYDTNGNYNKYYIPPDSESLAEFIAASDKNKLITSFDDWAILDSSGKNITVSVICDQYMEALYGNLIQYQDRYSNFHEKEQGDITYE